MRIAFSFASAPPFVKKKASMSPGVISASLAARRPRTLCSHERICVRQYLRLLFDGADDSLVAVPDIDAHQLAVEVDEAFVFRRPEVDALGARDGNRIHRGLSGPFEECVPATEFNDLLTGHGFSCNCHSIVDAIRKRGGLTTIGTYSNFWSEPAERSGDGAFVKRSRTRSLPLAVLTSLRRLLNDPISHYPCASRDLPIA